MGLLDLLKLRVNFPNRSRMTDTEMDILNQINISPRDFEDLFGKIILSEIIPRTRFISGRYTKPASGVMFYGNRIEPLEFLNYKKILEKFDLNFEMSYNIMSRRWQEFEHNKYTGKTPLIELDKDYFKIYPKKDVIDFFDQLNNYQEDKSRERKILERWQKDYDARLIWADGNTNLFLTPHPFDRKTASEIFEDMLPLSETTQEAIEKGWQSKDQFIDEYLARLPIISLSFYDH